MKKNVICVILGVVLILAMSDAYPNNLEITSFGIESQDETAHKMTLRFDIRWENSWRESDNSYDCAWIFLKWYNYGTQKWVHLKLDADREIDPLTFSKGFDGDSDGESDDIKIYVPVDMNGMFIYRSSNVSGTLDRDHIDIIWDYGVLGISDVDARHVIRLKIFGLEMVYVPEGPFCIGDGDGTGESTKAFHPYEDGAAVPSRAVDITQDEVQVTTTEGNVYKVDGDGGASKLGMPINAGFPVGYSSFYMMKYELTQGMYVELLNTLNRRQQISRVPVDISEDHIEEYQYLWDYFQSARNNIKCPEYGNGTLYEIKFFLDYNDDLIADSDDGQGIPMNYISAPDLLAFCQWAALRPMTETEFEKGARGNVTAANVKKGDLAWGTTTGTDAVTIVNAGKFNETVLESGNGLYRPIYVPSEPWASDPRVGPLRIGFGANDTTTRVEAGASCYGAFEMSGNLAEYTVCLGQYVGDINLVEGDGNLDDDGKPSMLGWPTMREQILVKGADGDISKQAVSYRGGVSIWDFKTSRFMHVGGRAARNGKRT